MNIYRKIYEQNYGPIPKDENGRTYEIHHIDGNRKNNNLSNLKAVSIQEHYDIHYSQGDWAACLLITRALQISPEEKSRLASLAGKESSKKTIANGTNLFASDNNPSKISSKNGTHHFFGGEIQRASNIKRVVNKTHNFQGSKNPVHERYAKGTHPFLDKEAASERNLKRIKDGVHNFLSNNPGKIQVTCPHCNKSGGQGGMKRHHFDKCKSKPIT